jgi:hypothetical protein
MLCDLLPPDSRALLSRWSRIWWWNTTRAERPFRNQCGHRGRRVESCAQRRGRSPKLPLHHQILGRGRPRRTSKREAAQRYIGIGMRSFEESRRHSGHVPLAWLFDPANKQEAIALRKNLPQFFESLAEQSYGVLVSPKGFASDGFHRRRPTCACTSERIRRAQEDAHRSHALLRPPILRGPRPIGLELATKRLWTVGCVYQRCCAEYTRYRFFFFAKITFQLSL